MNIIGKGPLDNALCKICHGPFSFIEDFQSSLSMPRLNQVTPRGGASNDQGHNLNNLFRGSLAEPVCQILNPRDSSFRQVDFLSFPNTSLCKIMFQLGQTNSDPGAMIGRGLFDYASYQISKVKALSFRKDFLNFHFYYLLNSCSPDLEWT